MRLIPIYYNENYLNKIADWRYDNKKHLRSFDDVSYDNQEAWVDAITESMNDHYYFIMDDTVEEWYNVGNEALRGYCGLDKVVNVNRTAEISLLIGTEYQQKGIGRQAVGLLLKKAFDEFNLNLVYAETYFNVGFWMKCGFSREAILRERKYWAGEYWLANIMSITKKEYYAR